jgi:hypothetical protein
LRRIEYQAARVAQNPNFDLNLESTRNLMQEKSLDLMTGIVRFLNFALIYFNHNFFANLLKSIGRGTEIYEAGKRQLENAIKEYDQAVYDLTASVVASNGLPLIP